MGRLLALIFFAVLGVLSVPVHEAAGAGAPSPDQELRDYQARADSESSGGFGSLADKLRGALEPRRK